MARLMGELRWAAAQFLKNGKDKTKFLIFLLHCSVIIIFRVIPNTVRKLLILPSFYTFDLDENMLNDIIVNFF
jgi:hypothetical protein